MPDWTDPRTWQQGELLTPELFNEQIRDNMLNLYDLIYPVTVVVEEAVPEVGIDLDPAWADNLKMIIYAKGADLSNSVQLRMRYNDNDESAYDMQRLTVESTTITAEEQANQDHIKVGNIPGGVVANFAANSTLAVELYDRNSSYFKGAQSYAAAYGAGIGLNRNSFIWKRDFPIERITLYPAAGDFETILVAIWGLIR